MTLPVEYRGKKMNTQGAVREVLKNLGQASLRQIREILNLTDQSGTNQVYRAVYDLVKSGEARRVMEGLYAYQKPRYQAPKKLGKIWRAIRSSRQFTLNDIVLLTGAGHDYIGQYLNHLKKEGYIVPIGNKKGGQLTYRTTLKAAPGVPPYSKRRRLETEKDKTWQEVKLKTWEITRLVVANEAKPSAKAVKELRSKLRSLTALAREFEEENYGKQV